MANTMFQLVIIIGQKRWENAPSPGDEATARMVDLRVIRSLGASLDEEDALRTLRQGDLYISEYWTGDKDVESRISALNEHLTLIRVPTLVLVDDE